MNNFSAATLDKVANLTDEQFSIVIAIIDEFSRENKPPFDVSKRIGIGAGKIKFPENFDDIDFGTDELFGLTE